MNVTQFENNRWQRDDQVLQFRHRATLALVESGASVLDLGSGDGLLLALLKEKGVKGVGLDISEEGVAKARAKGLEASVFDFSNKLPFKDGTFDCVIMLDLLEHLYSPEELLKEAQRVSKDSVIVGVPNFSSLPARLQLVLGRVPENNQPKKGHIFWFNHRVLTGMFGRVGLSLAEVRVNTFFESVPGVALLTKFLARVWPNLFSLSFVAVGKKGKV